MNELIDIANTQVPDFMRGFADSDNGLAAHVSKQYPVISIKGKAFTFRKGDQESVLMMAPPNQDTPANKMNVIIIKASPYTAKSYYDGPYNPDAVDKKPTCFSNDGLNPDASIEEPKCGHGETCKTCPHNQWVTVCGDNGQVVKRKACADSVRIAVASPTDVKTPFMMRVPPASINNLGDYGKKLKANGYPYQGVLTQIAFDVKEATPKLLFKAIEVIKDAKTFAAIQETAASETVQTMLGLDSVNKVIPIEAVPRTLSNSKNNNSSRGRVEESAKRAELTKTTQDVFLQQVAQETSQVVIPEEPVAAPAPAPVAKPAPVEDVKVVETADDLAEALSGFGSEFK